MEGLKFANIISFSHHFCSAFRKRLISASFEKIVVFLRPRRSVIVGAHIAYVNRLKDRRRQHWLMNRVCTLDGVCC